jgi:chorismate--pyruvate lyase
LTASPPFRKRFVKQIPFGKHRLEPRWQTPARFRHTGASADMLDWLLDATSLTQRLIAACEGKFAVHLCDQDWRPPMLNEARRLKVRPGRRAFVRQVYLLCDGCPWVFARTVIPVSTLTGPRRHLSKLGNKPLGAVLFADPSMRRSPVEIARLDASQPLFKQATALLNEKPEHIWGRRSVFRLHGHPLLVSEIFLPGVGCKP